MTTKLINAHLIVRFFYLFALTFFPLLLSASDGIAPPTPTIKGLIFTSVQNGDKYLSGQKININIAKLENRTLEHLGIRTSYLGSNVIDVVKVDPASLRTEYKIPDDILGPIELTVMGLDIDNHVIVTSDPITIHVQTNASLQDLDFKIEGNKVINKEYFINSTDLKHIQVVGTYSDGFRRYISHTSVGTKYELQDKEIASIDSYGRIKALLDGGGLLHVSNSGIKKTTVVNIFDVFGAAKFELIASPRKAYRGKELKLNIKAKNPQNTIPALRTELIPKGATFKDHGDGTGTFTWTPTKSNEKYETVMFLAIDPEKPEIVNNMVVDFVVY
jgi:hypothetical protein